MQSDEKLIQEFLRRFGPHADRSKSLWSDKQWVKDNAERIALLMLDGAVANQSKLLTGT